MFIDASAIVAILNDEADAQTFKQAIDLHLDRGVVSPLTIYEAAVSLAKARTLALSRRPRSDEFRSALRAVQAFMTANGLRTMDITPELAALAVETAAKFGKAVGHAADLNFGDCFAYACAKSLDVSLLYKGNDFRQTDIESAV